MKVVVCVLLLILCKMYGIFCQNDENNSKTELIILIKDFLKTWNQPLKIATSNLCWTRNQFYELTKAFSNDGLFVTPSYDAGLKTYWPHEHQVFILDLKCRRAIESLEVASQHKLLDHPFRWILIEDISNPGIPENLPIYISSKIYIIKMVENKFQIISKYRLGYKSQEYLTNDVAIYSNANKFEYIRKLIDAQNRTNLHGMLINITTVIVNNDTHNHLFDGRDKHIEPYLKVTYPLTMHVFEYVNATVRNIFTNTWGYKEDNSDYFVGMIGDLQNGTSEIGTTPIFVIKQRIPYMDPVFLSTPTSIRFIFRSPPLSYVQNIYTLPFNKYVWLSCLVLVVLIPVFLYIITYWEFNDESFNRNQKQSNTVSRIKPNLLDVLQLQIGAICQQGSESEPISSSGRIATLFLFLIMFFLYTSYSANIVALLQSTSDNINTLEDLLQTRIELGAEDVPYNRYFLKTGSGKIQQQIYLQKLAPPGKPDKFMTLEEGVSRIRNDFFAFHAEMTTIYKCISDTFLESEKCGLKEIDFFSMFPPYYVLRKNSTYGELFKVALRKMAERGINHRLYKRVYLKRPVCQTQGGNFLSVSLIDCYAPVLMYGIGVGIAFVVFVLEKCIYATTIHSNTNRNVGQI